jgi:hypothetical protein
MTTEKRKKTNADLLAEVIKTPSVNPLMEILVELNEQFDYGTTGKTIKTLNELLIHWFDSESADSSLGNKDDLKAVLFYTTRLNSFLIAVQDSFLKIKNSHPELAVALTR